MNKMVEKDERTVQVENISYKFGYSFISFVLLLDVMYRSFKFKEAPWDLLGIIILSGFLVSIYQFRQKTIGRSWVKATVLTCLLAAVVAAAILLLTRVSGIF